MRDLSSDLWITAYPDIYGMLNPIGSMLALQSLMVESGYGVCKNSPAILEILAPLFLPSQVIFLIIDWGLRSNY